MLFIKNSKILRVRQFFRIISQSPEYVKTHCKCLYNIFHFAIRKWIFTNNSKIDCFGKCYH